MTFHYLNQCWSSLLTHICVTRPQWVKLHRFLCVRTVAVTLRWRHNGHDSVSNHMPQDCLLKRLFRRRSKKTSKLRVIVLCVGNSPVPPWGIHRGPVNSPHKWPVTLKMFPFHDVILRKWESVIKTRKFHGLSSLWIWRERMFVDGYIDHYWSISSRYTRNLQACPFLRVRWGLVATRRDN